MRQTIEAVAVLGNGLMGTGISAVFAMAGKTVTMIGRDAGRAQAALDVVGKQIDEFAARGLISQDLARAARGRVSSSADPADAASCDFVMEAVTEDLAIKTALFARLDEVCPPDVVLASSSGQPASTLTTKVRHPERVLAAHFWFPATLIPVVEVCPSPATAQAATERTMALLREVGKEPVLMQRETPGMIGNRIQFAILREAWAMWAEGIASAEAIDTVVRQTLGRRLGITGPIESAELGGLDTLHAFAVSLLPHLDASPKPAPEVTQLVESGARGFANKKGIYDWSNRDGDALKAARVDELFRWLKQDAGQ
jgi:3-hydroxybutyryl-CoA dehydrogenase